MNEDLTPIALPPGLMTNGTPYAAKGRWGGGDMVRFFEGTVRPIGGWRRLKGSTGADLSALAGVPRAAISWRTNAGELLIAIGTTSHLYVIAAGALVDITPAGFVAGVPDSGPSGGEGAYGSGAYGVGAYSEGSAIAGFKAADTWQLTTFGEYLVAVCTSDNKLYIWQGDVSMPAAQASGSPLCVGALVTDQRFLVALGAAGDIRSVAWASQETIATWTPTDSNTAGDFPLSTQGGIMCGRQLSASAGIWTDIDLWIMSYLGDTDLIYSFKRSGDHCGLIAPNALAVVDGKALWMGQDTFYAFDGYVQRVPCEVSDSVFGDLNWSQRAKIYTSIFTAFGEIWFWYPSAMSTEIDSYVCYNYAEQHWALGKIVRTAGATDGATDFPILVDADGVVWEHECLFDRQGAVPWIESGPIELGAGDNVMKVNRIVPDEKNLGDVSATIFTSFFPTDTEVENGPYTLSAPTAVRLTARQIRLRFQEVVATSWRIGVTRLGLRTGGRR